MKVDTGLRFLLLLARQLPRSLDHTCPTMLHPFVVFVASLPLLFRLAPIIIPAQYLELYTYWSSDELNRRPGGTVAKTRWRNMGYWEVHTRPPLTVLQLMVRTLIPSPMPRKPSLGSCLTLPTRPEVGRYLVSSRIQFLSLTEDVAHGAGESLRLHLQSSPPPSHLHGLTSLPSESTQAQALLNTVPHPNTSIQLFVSGASFRPTKDIDHPLNPMRGYLGKTSHPDLSDEVTGYEDDDEAQEVLKAPAATGGPPPYDLIYVLDAIYHFPPAVPHFLASALKVLRPGEGVIAYTDILPPPKVGNVMGHLVLPPLLSVPTRNIMSRPKDLQAYREDLEKIGYEDVRVEDWSQAVWPGFAQNLRQRGLGWRLVAWVIGKAERAGWKFIAVRAKRPAQTLAHD